MAKDWASEIGKKLDKELRATAKKDLKYQKACAKRARGKK